MSELVDSDVVFRGMATCEDSDGSRVAEYFIVPRRKGGFVMFSVTPALSFAPYIRPAPRSEAGSAKPIEFTTSFARWRELERPEPSSTFNRPVILLGYDSSHRLMAIFARAADG
jgi:hypothetical protein